MKIIYIIIIGIIILYIYKILTFVPKYNNKKIIQKSQKYKPTKLLVVAHPDDEIFWGYNYIKDNPQNWKIICLTGYNDNDGVNGFINVMNSIGIKNYEIWNHNSDIYATKVHKNCIQCITNDINKYNYKMILTHNFYGEYGNLQHMNIHREMNKLKNKYGYPIKFFTMDKFNFSKNIRKHLRYYKSKRLIINMVILYLRIIENFKYFFDFSVQ